jgi:hypothetical protein
MTKAMENGHKILELGMSGVYTAGSLKSLAKNEAKYNLGLVGIQEVRWH